MKTKKYKELGAAELDKELKEAQAQLQKSKFSMAGSRAKDVKHDQKTRRNIARMLTAKRMNTKVK